MGSKDANQFVPVRVSTLRGDTKINFDVYVKINDKFIMYCRSGDSFEGARLLRLKQKKLKKMFIAQDHEDKYRKYLEHNIESAYDSSSGKPIEVRAEIIQGAQQAAAENMMEDPESKVFYEVARAGVSRYVDFILKENQAFRCVVNIVNEDGQIGHHGVTVATLAIGMAKQLGFSDSQPMSLLTLGGLIHDIEHSHNGLVLNRKLNEFPETEIATYRAHPMAGVERIRRVDFFDKTVIEIVAKHEEAIDGTGFPQGLRENVLDTNVMCVAVANRYDRYVAFEKLDKKAALKTLLVEQMGRYPLEVMQALQTVLKAEGVI